MSCPDSDNVKIFVTKTSRGQKCTLLTAPMCPIALPPMLCTELVNYVLFRHRSPTTLIICSTRESFLEDLQACIKSTRPQTQSEDLDEDLSASSHHLLIPTIHQIALSRTINLAFTPTLPHLRAYLAAYDVPPVCNSTLSPADSRVPILAIWGMATLHRSTFEHSAQGLSRTLAIAVEAATQAGQNLVLAESSRSGSRDDNATDDILNFAADNPWKEQVPLLSGSVRFAGEDRAWAGRTIEVGRVMARWCKFTRTDNLIIRA